MPDVDANRRQWDGDYEWPDGGDEWSADWGGPDAQWFSSLEPRLRSYLPAASILEIAPGYGRWTRFLLGRCDRYVGVDISSRCIDACRRRFADHPHANFHVGDGMSLTAVPDASIDLAFSFDALVHVEEDVIAGYLGELARTLTPAGVAFLHHSNLAACRPVPRPLRAALGIAERAIGRETGGFDMWRGVTVSAGRVRELAVAAGMTCVGQELVGWQGGRLIDCISVLTRRGSAREKPTVVVENPYFMLEAASAACVARLHGPARPATADCATAPPVLSRAASARIGPWGLYLVGPRPRYRRRSDAG